MFKRSDNDSLVPEAGPTRAPQPLSLSSTTKSEQAFIGASLLFKGELSGEGNLHVEGRVEGSIDLRQSQVTVGRKGNVQANVQARVITVEGYVDGDLNGEEGVVIKQSGDVRGNVSAPRVHLEDGAKFKGSIDMRPVSKDSPSATAEDADGPVGELAATEDDAGQVQPTDDIARENV